MAGDGSNICVRPEKIKARPRAWRGINNPSMGKETDTWVNDAYVERITNLTRRSPPYNPENNLDLKIYPVGAWSRLFNVELIFLQL